jgi:ABC-type branched-subunit amino acid transport system substrate-binding protein
MRRAARKALIGGLTTASVVVGLAACGSSGGSHATLAFDNFAPFTGADAAFGPALMAGCWPAVEAINSAGGVLGHKTTCLATNDKDDPADAVPIARLMLARTSNLVGINGPNSDSAMVVDPLIGHAKIPYFVAAGQPILDHSTDPYFWRILPGDDATGLAMAAYAFQKGYRRAAFVFTTDTDAQSNKPSAVVGWKRLGGKDVAEQNLAPQQASYDTEASQVASAHPDVILTEMDPQSAATFFRNYQQIAKLPAIVGTSVTLEPFWTSAVGQAIGRQNLARILTGVRQNAESSGPAWQAYDTALRAAAGKVPDAKQWTYDPSNEQFYDGFTIMALAMAETKSTDPGKYNSAIMSIANGQPGAVVVRSYAAGVQALKKGEHIRYEGAGGAFTFNKYHNASLIFGTFGYDPSVQGARQTGVVSAAEIDRARGTGSGLPANL